MMRIHEYGVGNGSAMDDLYDAAQKEAKPGSSGDAARLKAVEALAHYQAFKRAMDVSDADFASSESIRSLAVFALAGARKMGKGRAGSVLAEALDEAIGARKAVVAKWLIDAGAPAMPAAGFYGFGDREGNSVKRAFGQSLGMSALSWFFNAARLECFSMMPILESAGFGVADRKLIDAMINAAVGSGPKEIDFIAGELSCHPWVAASTYDEKSSTAKKEWEFVLRVQKDWAPATSNQESVLWRALELVVEKSWSPSGLDMLGERGVSMRAEAAAHWESELSRMLQCDWKKEPSMKKSALAVSAYAKKCQGSSLEKQMARAVDNLALGPEKECWIGFEDQDAVLTNLVWIKKNAPKSWMPMDALVLKEASLRLSCAASAGGGKSMAMNGRAQTLKTAIEAIEAMGTPSSKLKLKSAGPKRV